MTKKILIGVTIVVLVVGIGVAVGWLASRGPAPAVPETSEQLPQIPARTADVVSVSAPPPEPVSHRAMAPIATAPVENQTPILDTAPAQATNADDLMTNWADRVDDIIAADDDDTNKVRQLLALFPKLPADGQVEVAQHLSNLTPDEDYAPLAKLLENAKLPEDALDVLLGDALNRPNSLKLPELLTIAQNPDHPKAGEAKDLLELFLGQDYGDNWNAWQQKTAEWLQQNPD